MLQLRRMLMPAALYASTCHRHMLVDAVDSMRRMKGGPAVIADIVTTAAARRAMPVCRERERASERELFLVEKITENYDRSHLLTCTRGY